MQNPAKAHKNIIKHCFIYNYSNHTTIIDLQNYAIKQFNH